MTPSSKYPGIYKAALEIAYDNGGINRGRSEAKHRREFDRFLERQPDHDRLAEIDRYLAGLSKHQLLTVCAGEEIAAKRFLRESKAPMFTDALLNDIFEKVC